MLKSVQIKNYVLVEEGKIDFEPGLNVITGETGAGKSILIGALATLLGERTSVSVLRDACASLVLSLYEKEESVLEILGRALHVLENIGGIDSTLGHLKNEINTALISVEEVAKALQSYAGRIEVNPERLEEIRLRLAAFAQLKKKYATSIEGIIEKKDGLRGELEQIETIDTQIDQAQKMWQAAAGCYMVSARELSNLRKNTAEKLQRAVPEILAEIGMQNCCFEVNLASEEVQNGWCEIDGKSVQAHRDGVDRVEFYISANPGQPLRPLAKIVSGGEISRIMLALKSLIAHADRIPVLIFDEIDLGISGRIAEAVGKKLRALAKSHQIIVITHLPQIAGAGHCHFLVEKAHTDSATTSFVRKLSEEERERAIAQLLAGHEITETHLASARELLKNDT